MAKRWVEIDLNRVEGDLAFHLEIDEGVITDARCSGTLYRGFEQILLERVPRDSLVITPRICGICGTAHLYAAVLALEHLWQLPVPPNAHRIRNLCLMAENFQSDLRQSFLFFTVDFCNPRYAGHPLAAEIHAAFAPVQGRIYRQVLDISREFLRIVAVFGGQWPHSAYMLPGGVVTPPSHRRIIECLGILDNAVRWCEQTLLGCSLETWLGLSGTEEFYVWLEQPAHAASAIGLFTRFAHSLNLHQQGAGTPHMLSYGAYCDPESWKPPYTENARLLPAGFYNGGDGKIEPFDQARITEHVRHSWYQQYPGGLHPFNGKTVPDYQPQTDRYTWAKAPRYQEKPVQTGPLAELLVAGEPLITSLHQTQGGNAWLRQFARLRRATLLLVHMRSTLEQLRQNLQEPHMQTPSPEAEVDGEGFGLIMSARGALGHWVKTYNGLIRHYQIITPTAWSASPRDSNGIPGHWEQSLIGINLVDPEDPVEAGLIIRSHDPCLVCTVHLVDATGKETVRRF